MVKKEVLAALIDVKKAAVLKVVLNSTEEMYLKEIAAQSKVSITSTFRILQELVELEVLRKRHWKTSKVYSCERNDKVEFLKELFKEEFDGVQAFIDAVQGFTGIQQIIMHGERSRSNANVLLIGEYINTNRVEEVCKELRLKGFELSFVTLTKKQYGQMLKMGLYAGEKKRIK